MFVRHHIQATSKLEVRADIQANEEYAWVLVVRHGTTQQAVRKGRHGESLEDRCHTSNQLKTSSRLAQEAAAVAPRRALQVTLDDLLALVYEFLNMNVSRCGLDRCMRRHGVGHLSDLEAEKAKPKHSAFKSYELRYLHIDVMYLPLMADVRCLCYIFGAIDRATSWVFIRIYNTKLAANAGRNLRDLWCACPIRNQTIIANNWKEFTERLFDLRKRAATGKHDLDTLFCAALEIEHRPTPPKPPQTNAIVERFEVRIEDVPRNHHFRSDEELETTLHSYVWIYNQLLPQSTLGRKTPLQAVKDWEKLKPDMFKKKPFYLMGCEKCYNSRLQNPRPWSVKNSNLQPAGPFGRDSENKISAFEVRDVA